MAINLSKSSSSTQYYYSKGGKEFGPFDLASLLEKIDRDTLVWKDGIDWCEAESIPEISKFFPTIAKVEPKSVQPDIPKAPVVITPPLSPPAIKVTDHAASGAPTITNTQSSIPAMENKNDEVVGMFAHPFSFDGRIRRMEYGLSLLAYVVGYYVVIGLTTTASIFGLLFIPMFWFLWAQGAKRCHDRGNTGWFQLIPFYGLIMLFGDGDVAANELGSSQKKR